MLAVGMIAIAVCAAVFVALTLVRDELDMEIRQGSRAPRNTARSGNDAGDHVLRDEMK